MAKYDVNEIKKALEVSESAMTAAEAEIEGFIAEYNKVLVEENNFSKLSRIEAQLKEAEKVYAENAQQKVFQECVMTEKPVVSAIRRGDFITIAHRAKKGEAGSVEGLEATEKSKIINLVAFCKYAGRFFDDISTDWQYDVERFAMLMVAKSATELGYSKAYLKQLSDTYAMNEIARKLDEGSTPTSNTALCKQLQKVFDALIFEDNGKGENVYKATGKDLRYFAETHARAGKGLGTLKMCSNTEAHRLVMNILNTVICKRAYGIAYKEKKESEAKVSEAKVSEAEAQTPEVTEVEVEREAA